MQVSAEYPPAPGGVGDYTARLGDALTRRHRVVVATGRCADAGSPGPIIQPIAGNWSWRSLPALAAAIRRWQPQIVHIQYQTGAYAMRPAINLAPWYIRRAFPQTAVVVTMHDLRMPYLLPKAAPLRRWLTRRLLTDADAVVVTNAADRAALDGEGVAERDVFLAQRPIAASVIPIGSNIDVAPPPSYERAEWRARVGAGDEDIVVAFFGLVSSTKGLLPLVQALASLPPSIRLLVIGGEAPQPQDHAYRDEVLAAVERLQLASRVTFTGHSDPADVSAYLLAADIAALPFADGASYRRGSLLAALAHGLPVITTAPSQPLTPALHPGEHALLVPPNDPVHLANAIAGLATDPALRHALGTGGRHLAQHFEWSSIAAAHEDVYNALVQRIHRAR